MDSIKNGKLCVSVDESHGSVVHMATVIQLTGVNELFYIVLKR